MKRIVAIIVFSLAVGMSINVTAQKSVIKKGDKAFDNGQYTDALNYYQKANSKDAKDMYVVLRLANCYYLLNNTTKSLEFFNKAGEKNMSATDLFVYGNVLQTIEEYQKAIAIYQAAEAKGNQNRLLKKYIRSCNWAMDNQTETGDAAIATDVKINGASLGQQYYGNSIVFSAYSTDQRDESGNQVCDMYFATANQEKIGEPQIFSKDLVYPNREGSPSFTANKMTMYFTKIEMINTGKYSTKIIEAQYNGKDWKKNKPVTFNSSRYACTSPAISEDGSYMIFAADMSDGNGGFDLYKIEKKGDIWGAPTNLGTDINTPGDEKFPFLGANDKLIFASNGHLGYGGYDIYSADKAGNTWSNPTNLGKPVNSPRNDFALVTNPTNPKEGYFSSNRVGNGNIDYIFFFEQAQKNTPPTNVVNNNTKIDEPAIENEINTESYFEKRFNQKLIEYGVKSTSQLDRDKRRKFYDELYNEEKLYSDKTKKKLSEYGVSRISELSEKQREMFYSELHNEEFGESETNTTNTNTTVQTGEKIIYKVQFESSVKPLDELPVIEGFYTFRYYHQGLYRYTIGEFDNVDAADKLKQKIIGKGYNDAFVVAFKNNQRVLVPIYKK